MREQGKSEASGQRSEQARESPEEAYRNALPPEFVSVIGQAAPEIVGMLLQNHPQMATPLMPAINQLRGHGFAQLRRIRPNTRRPHQPLFPAHAEPRVPPEVRKMRAIAGWNQLATAVPNEGMTPEHVRIPDNLVQAIDRAWQETLAASSEQEKGGNIVKNGGSGYDVRRYGGDANGETFQPDDNDVGWRQRLVGMVHTHPYGEYKQQVPEGYASFSEQDFDAFMRSDAHLSVLRSGPIV